MVFNRQQHDSEVIADVYSGEIASSEAKSPVPTDVIIHPLRNQIIKVSFIWNERKVNFRGVLVATGEGIIIVIQEKVCEDYVLNGIEGFLHNTPNAHGGLIQLLNGVFFNISLSFYSGSLEQLYFFGKKKEINGIIA